MKIIKKYKYYITILLIIITIVFVIFIKQKLNNEKYQNITTIDNSVSIPMKEIKKEDEEECIIDIKGAVNNPGVYQISCNSTVNDAIKLAGDLTNEANTSIINLAKKITNEMVIIIYTDEEVKNSNVVNTVVKIVEKECVCPNIQNDSCLNTQITDTISNSDNVNNNLININTATLEEIKKIPGIGESKAKAILEYRNEFGKFNTIEDIQKVNGIGSKLYEEIKTYITT